MLGCRSTNPILGQHRRDFLKFLLGSPLIAKAATTYAQTAGLAALKLDTPFICPVGEQRAFHPEGELATARAAKSKKVTQILSTVTSTSIEDVAKALGTAPWYQLYMPPTWDATEKRVRRAEAAGAPALAWTVDLLGGRNTETMERFRRMGSRQCTSCHAGAR